MLDNTVTELPSAVYIRERLDYDPGTGVFVWRYCETMPRRWNTRWAGKVAGTDHNHGYRQIMIGRHFAHRLAWVIATGEWPQDQLDHVNGVRNDNRISNLRIVSNTENGRNAAMRSDNTSGVTGVCWAKREGKWMAYITVDQRLINLGYFDNPADAISARKAAEITYGFHANHGRPK
jgi:hypothetical protein